MGSNPESARLAGVPVTRVLVGVYAIAGRLAAFGGVLILVAAAFDQWQGRRSRGG